MGGKAAEVRIKSQPSTAQRLALFREALAQHYRALRSDKCKQTPKPSAQQFEGYAKQMAEKISGEELEKHNKAVAETERLKEMNR